MIESLELFVDNALQFLDGWGFILVIMFGIIHPLFENPLSLFNLTLAITIVGIPLGYTLVIVSTLIGLLVLHVIAMQFNSSTHDYLFKKKVSRSVLEWIDQTPMWKHIIVIGVPMIPTYPVKIGVALSKMGFKKYMITLSGAYAFLLFANSLIYFGIAGLVTDIIPNYVSFILLFLLALYIYFGNKIFQKRDEEVIE